ncbi:MAG TPA: MarR family transcriptional regulator [Rariglobus sp.]
MSPSPKARTSSDSDPLSEETGAAIECLSQPLRMLVRIARQSRIGDPEACATVLTLLSTSRLLHNHFQRVLAQLDLSEVKLTTLVSLYALDPEPSTPADLAVHSQVSRATMTETLEALRVRNWIVRERGRADRRVILIHLTDEGRALVERAVRPFLATVNLCAQALTRDERAAAVRICTHLNRFFQPQSA